VHDAARRSPARQGEIGTLPLPLAAALGGARRLQPLVQQRLQLALGLVGASVPRALRIWVISPERPR